MSHRPFIDTLLDEQQSLTAVDGFARWQEISPQVTPVGRYRELIPAVEPLPGQQYAFEVDLDRCSGCKACVTACHALNGLDEEETWRRVGLLVSAPTPRAEPTAFALQQHVTTACHHCVDPACLNGCPVLAYDKDPITGIVRHLDDQCMGCSYCVMKCPYEVPQYSKRLGIVRKCDLCSDRLASGEAPACAQACPSEAIRITLVDQQEVAAQFRNSSEIRIAGSAGSHSFLPDAPNPSWTLPTTQYRTRHDRPDLVAADSARLRLEPAHWPLVWMLVLTQAAAGVFLAGAVVGWREGTPWWAPLTAAGCLMLGGGLAASVLHLGRPGKAWRAFLGWRKSWLSREIIAFNLFAGAAGATLVAALIGLSPSLVALLIGATAKLGILGVLCSAMVYVDTRRPFWSGRHVFGSFLGTTLLLGTSVTAPLLAWMGAIHRWDTNAGVKTAAASALILRSLLFLWTWKEFQVARREASHPCHLNARILQNLLPEAVALRLSLFMLSMFFGLLVLLSTGDAIAWWATAALLTTFGSELVGRYLFFVASASQRMPGGVNA